ncbi:hypothetical protein RRG08_058644 [Elysia crispata]|uniref:Uncharacterized protein n=1 Tax=Elysia crispata TaxID=231223 RepID=A0AAE0Z1Z4_9GAST|nr:hypothetical protein RRG08_058644 [Elysia crispata]
MLPDLSEKVVVTHSHPGPHPFTTDNTEMGSHFPSCSSMNIARNQANSIHPAGTSSLDWNIPGQKRKSLDPVKTFVEAFVPDVLPPLDSAVFVSDYDKSMDTPPEQSSSRYLETRTQRQQK